MSRKITSEEREILLKNRELVMFSPYSVFKTHRLSLGKAFILPAAVIVLVLLWCLFFPEFIHDHPTLFALIGCGALMIAAGALPVLYITADDRAFKKAEEEHYVKQLKMLLPQDAVYRTARILWVTEEKAEGGWIMDGREEMFGYSSYVNCFPIEPDTDLAVITGGRFCAFIKRNEKTECFYKESEQ